MAAAGAKSGVLADGALALKETENKIIADLNSLRIDWTLCTDGTTIQHSRFFYKLAIWARFAGPVNSVHLDIIKFKF